MVDENESAETASTPGGPLRPRRWLWTTIAVAVAAGVIGLIAGQFIVSPRQLAAEAAPPTPSLITATVTEGIVENTVIARGTVASAVTVGVGLGQLLNPAMVEESESADPTAVITAILAKRGQSIPTGTVVVEVSGRPLLVMPGSRPMYRDITPGMSGPDVSQLQSGLTALGLLPGGAVDGVYGPATQQAVSRLYEARGYTPLPTDHGDGSDAESVRAARATVTSAQRALDDILRRDNTEVDAVEVSRAREDVSTAQASLSRVQSQIGPVILRNELAFVPTLPMRITSMVDSTGAAPPILFVLANESLVLRLSVPTPQVARLTADAVATFELGGSSFTGVITSSAPSAKAGNTDVVVQPHEPLAFERLGETLSVSLSEKLGTAPGLLVPSGAVSTAPSGQRTVIRVDAGDALHRIDVTVGSSGDGSVEVRPRDPAELSVGDKVLVGG
jgi:peptidoglycan hydrolase-like protein with peptidoglycan-binding domain